jgi:two-component system, OmpR family, sensor histidine kinase MtrB
VAALVVLTTRLQRASAMLEASVESVRLAEEAQIDLLLHGRTADPVVRRRIESDMRSKLAQAAQFVTTETEADSLREAGSRMEAYLAAARDTQGVPPQEGMESAYGAMEALVDINVAQARAAQDRTASWERSARFIGTAAAALLLAVSGLLVWWLSTRAFRPVFGLARAMEAFGGGERGARAEETGPAELREMAARFNEMASALAAQRDAQMAFLAGVAHDLRGPLSTLRVAVATMPPDRPLGTEADVRRTLALVARQITRLERMVGDFLDRARIEAGKLELQVEDCDVRAVVQDVVDLFAPASGQHRFAVSLPPDRVMVRCDALRIEQVVTNLVSNAVKYSPDGGVVGVALRDLGGGVEIEVVDHGIGMSDEDRRRLFEPFRRVGGESRHSIPGVGLGLFVVRQIVAAHGGRIEVESQPGHGSTFRFRLGAPPEAGAPRLQA